MTLVSLSMYKLTLLLLVVGVLPTEASEILITWLGLLSVYVSGSTFFGLA